VVIEFIGDHTHDSRSLDDLRTLSLSSDIKANIRQRLKDGFDKRDVRAALQKHQRGTVYHRDQHTYADEIYAIYYKILNYNSHLDLNQHEYVKIWMTNLEQKGFGTFIGENFVTNTLLD
jgi:hypothetical protein